jgi:hypothetical protein
LGMSDRNRDFWWANLVNMCRKSSLTILANLVEVGAASQPLDSRGRTIFVVDAHRGDGQRFIVRADEKLTAFLELESVVRAAELLL